ncbi:MAG: DNA double-strand break repair nuclease NurA [Thermofilum sp.]
MPRFADLFVEEVRRKRGEILRVAAGSADLASRYRELVRSVWVEGVEARNEFDRVYAVDSSSDEIEVAGGGVILVTRAVALGANGRELRKLRVDAFFPRSIRDYEDFKRLLREHLEHEVALEAVEEGADLVLLDGSLFGRMSHVVRELSVDGREGFLLDYVETYGQLLSRAVRKGVIIAGVSKDSRSTVLKEELLLSELRKRLEGCPTGLAEKVLELWARLRRRPSQVLEEVRRLVKEGLDPRIYELFEEAKSPVPDSKLLLLMNLGPGFTAPIRLTLERVQMGVIEVALTEETRLVALLDAIFEKVSDELGPRFAENVNRVLAALRSYPAVLASYVIFSRGDDPVRVDIAVNREDLAASTSRFVSSPPDSFIRVLRQLAFLYSGRTSYNVLLLEADKRVRATAETLDLYHKLAMKELGELIVHSRGERRYFVP